MRILEYKENGKVKCCINMDLITFYESGVRQTVTGETETHGVYVYFPGKESVFLNVSIDDFTRKLYTDTLGMLTIEGKE